MHSLAYPDVKYWQAINRALADEMADDPRVVLLGEDVGRPGGAFGASRGLLERFGTSRVRDTPISELALAGVGLGAALVGLRPIIEIMFNDFLTLAMDQIVNQAAKFRFMSGGKARVPLVIRTGVGSGKSTGPQHSQSLEAWFAHTPGLRVVFPATTADAYGLLRAAIRDDNPVLVFESLRAWNQRGPIEDDCPMELGRSSVRRHGKDLTLVTIGSVLGRALLACNEAASEGIDIELIDLRSIQPLDYDTLQMSLTKTGRLVVAHDAVGFLGLGSELAAWAAGEGFAHLRAPVGRVAALDTPPPFAPHLETAYFPSTRSILEACRQCRSFGN
jgi:pyruvate/2-oxoglutarate/acetoin dehydrogenase E1 component